MLNIDLKNKVAIITGTTSGVGAGIAAMFLKAGCHVSGCGRKEETHAGVKEFLNNAKAEGIAAIYTKTDVTKDEELEQLVDNTINHFGRIDFLISNAGVNVFEGVLDCSNADFESNMNLNLRSHWKISQLCKPYLEKSDNGTILIMTSNHAYYSIPGCFPYNVTKTAIKGLVQSIAIEWGPKIRAVGIAPGFIQTAGNDTWLESFPDPEAERNRTNMLHPVERIGTPEEVGALCAFLCTQYARFINGTTYLMDGGRSAIMQDT
jgi:NAD(P)-dependent dehydrogenase (short-subunit alcohol dehydrogenase family)